MSLRCGLGGRKSCEWGGLRRGVGNGVLRWVARDPSSQTSCPLNIEQHTLGDIHVILTGLYCR